MRLSENPNRGRVKWMLKRFFALDKLQILSRMLAVWRFLFPVPCFFTTSLVTNSGAFYNPSNTTLKTVVSFTRYHGAQPPGKTGRQTVSGYMNIDLHFRSSQEY
jgi:hypothetical protein